MEKEGKLSGSFLEVNITPVPTADKYLALPSHTSKTNIVYNRCTNLNEILAKACQTTVRIGANVSQAKVSYAPFPLLCTPRALFG